MKDKDEYNYTSMTKDKLIKELQKRDIEIRTLNNSLKTKVPVDKKLQLVNTRQANYIRYLLRDRTLLVDYTKEILSAISYLSDEDKFSYKRLLNLYFNMTDISNQEVFLCLGLHKNEDGTFNDAKGNRVDL